MRWHRRRRATPQIGRNRHQPEGLRAARGHLLRCRSSTMSRIAFVAAPRIWPLGARNESRSICD
ncbi:MAG TPA: hypothetical protein VLV78_04830, partial [Thermoanaerobaculia bacterium]|nr:hypothetical protein [Thermoanaerobaculia bacterium]